MHLKRTHSQLFLVHYLSPHLEERSQQVAQASLRSSRPWPYWALSQPPSAGITAVPCCTWLLFASTQPLSGLKAQAEGRTCFTNCGASYGIKLEGGCCPYHSGITAAYHQSLALTWLLLIPFPLWWALSSPFPPFLTVLEWYLLIEPVRQRAVFQAFTC